jgi:hypothetical protein
MRDQRIDDLRICTGLFLALLLTFAFIGPGYEGVKNNSVPRLGVIFAMIADGSLTIDKYRLHTPDMAFFDGHYYSDKAPGLSLMAAPFVALFMGAAQLAGTAAVPVRDGQFTDFAMMASHVATAASSSLAVALTASVLFLLARWAALSRGAALFGALVYGLASPAFGWATMFLGHAVTGACLFIAFALIMQTERSGRLVLRGVAIGAILTWGCVVEYTTGLAAAIVGLFGVSRLARMPAQASVPAAIGVAIGAMIALAPLLAYNQAAFGNPLTIGYQYVVGFDQMKQGTMGLGLPKAKIAWELLFGSFRGILWLSPVLVLLPLAWCASARRFPADVVVVLIAVPVAYYLVNSGYFDWSGGASTGPRHLVPALAFAGFAFAALWDWLRSAAAHVIFVALLLISAALSILCASTTMGAPNTPDQPLVAFLWHGFATGDIHNVLMFLLRRVPGWGGAGTLHLLTVLVIPVLWTLAFLLTRMLVRPAAKRLAARDLATS